MLQLSFEVNQDIVIEATDGSIIGKLKIVRANKQRARIEFDLPESMVIAKGVETSKYVMMDVLCCLPKTPESIGERELARELDIKVKQVRGAIASLKERGFLINTGLDMRDDLNKPPVKRLDSVYGLSVVSWDRAQEEGKLYIKTKASR